MCACPPYQDGVVEELYDNNQPMMASVDVENIMPIPGHQARQTQSSDVCFVIFTISQDVSYVFPIQSQTNFTSVLFSRYCFSATGMSEHRPSASRYTPRRESSIT